MSSKFFNNDSGNTLFDKLKGIASGMANFDRFLAVVGFFRSSGYFKLRKELGNVEEIKILVGINIDDIFRRHNKTMLMLESAEKAKVVYDDEFRQDIINARYAPEVEEGILQMCQDLVDGRLQMQRIFMPSSTYAFLTPILRIPMAGSSWGLPIFLIQDLARPSLPVTN